MSEHQGWRWGEVDDAPQGSSPITSARTQPLQPHFWADEGMVRAHRAVKLPGWAAPRWWSWADSLSQLIGALQPQSHFLQGCLGLRSQPWLRGGCGGLTASASLSWKLTCSRFARVKGSALSVFWLCDSQETTARSF